MRIRLQIHRHSFAPVALSLASSLFVVMHTSTSARAANPASPGVASVLQPFVDSHTLAGAVTLVASKDKVLALEAVGSADIASGKPMQTNDLFWIASMNKAFTAAALMILVDEGKVDVNAPISKYLPEFKDQWLAVERDNDHLLLKRPPAPVTVKNILTHTSGMPFSTLIEQPTFDVIPLRDAVRSYAMAPLQFAPGTKYQYSNAGINTAGRIIEVMSGMPYEKFLRERLLDPLGMSDTVFRPSEEQVARLAKSYKPNASKTGLEETTVTQLRYPLTDPSRVGFPAGGLFSTASDVGRFCQMLLNDGVFNGRQILSAQAVRQMTSSQTGDVKLDDHDSSGYGFGLSVTKHDGGTKGLSAGSYGHGGAYSTLMQVDPRRGLVMVLLVQHAGYGPDGGKINPSFITAAIEKFGQTGGGGN
jgi:CubicO group peptidase (beta-lactamase class C family)